MTFLNLVAEDNIESVEDLNRFFMVDYLTEEYFNDVEKLKEWIQDDTNCMWFIEEFGESIHIMQFNWEEDERLYERIMKKREKR